MHCGNYNEVYIRIRVMFVHDLQVYIWGRYFGKSIISPVLSSHKQLDNVFSSSTVPFAMWRNLTLGT